MNQVSRTPDAGVSGPAALRAPRTLGMVVFPAYDWAISPDHPEREERLLYTQDQLREEGLFDVPGIFETTFRPALKEDIFRAHFCPPGLAAVLQPPHLASAGGAMAAGELVLAGLAERSFALTRPPGHHAMKMVRGGRGFCAVNIEAVMIERLRRDHGVRRVAVVDTDCHHGDGTQDIYWHDPDTLFISVHQDGRTLYPGSGFPGELGGPGARGTTVNIPLPPGTGDEGFFHVTEQLIRPLLDAWKPDLVVNSAGQDNHFTDPITHMRLSARGYGRMVERINPHIAVLEGGYSIQGALPYVNLAVALALAGMSCDAVIEPEWRPGLCATAPAAMEEIRRLTDTVAALQARPESVPHGYEREHGWWVREREIYYDTDGISERQREELRICDACPGLLVLRSRVGRAGPSTAVDTPRRACATCRSAGEALFASLKRAGAPAEFADRDQDRYQRSGLP